MTSELLRTHLRAALDEAIAQESQRLHAIYDASDAHTARRVEKLRPLLTALTALRDEVGAQKGVDISPSVHGHMATVRLTSSTLIHSLSISTTYENTAFQVEENRLFCIPGGGNHKQTHKCTTADAALAIVVKAVADHIAQNQVLEQRNK